MMTDRIGTMFHESFSYSRKSVSQILQAIANDPSILNVKQSEREKVLLEKTLLGTRYIKAMPKYAMGSGLIHSSYQLTTLGHSVLSFDPSLDQSGTQWLLHYHLSAPHGPGPRFWNDIVSERFYAGSIFSLEDLAEQVGNFIWQNENKVLAQKSVKSTIRIFLGTYTKPEGLGRLSLVEESQSGRCSVRESAVASAWIVGYALLDFWAANYPGRVSVSLDTLHESGFAKLFLMGRTDLESALQALQVDRHLEIHRTAPPYQVVLLRSDPESLLRKIYDAD